MIYERPQPGTPISQGDIIDGCPVLVWAAETGTPEPAQVVSRVVVMTQACDLAQGKATRALVALVHGAQELADRGVLKAKVIRDHVRSHRVYGWYFLPSDPLLPESIVDLRDLHTIPRAMLDGLVAEGKRVCRLRTPYREHLGQHFSSTYSRIGLPEPYGTD